MALAEMALDEMALDEMGLDEVAIPQKFLQHISHSHTYMYFAHPIVFFCVTNFEKKYEFIRYGFSLVCFLVLILIRSILKQSINNKMVGKI